VAPGRDRTRPWARALLVAAAFLLLLLGPLALNTYWLRVLTTVFMYGVLVSALNLMAGYTGYPAFGNVVFFGLGAYGTALAMARLGASFWMGLPLGVLVCALFAAVVGPAALRLRGHYFAVATLGMNEATRALVENLSSVTGGGMGLFLPIRRGDVQAVNTYFYLVMLAFLGAVVGATFWLSRSRFGYGCRAIRFDEEGAAGAGVPTMRYKVTAWVLSAGFTGAAGGVYAHWFGEIEPAVVFDMTIAVKCFVMMLLGGSGTVLGPLFGAVLIEAVSLAAWSRLLTYHTAVLGLLIILVVVFIPGGLTSLRARRPSLRLVLASVRENRL
jgi:branched-chain amino acid transport system permease protein